MASTDIQALERALIKSALARYREWKKANGVPNAWGDHPNVATKKGHDMLMATKALFDAKAKK